MIQQVLNTAEGAVKDLSSFGRNRKGEYTPSKTQNTRDSINNLIEIERKTIELWDECKQPEAPASCKNISNKE